MPKSMRQKQVSGSGLAVVLEGLGRRLFWRDIGPEWGWTFGCL